MNVEEIEKEITRPLRRRVHVKSPLAEKMKRELAERRARLADYFYYQSDPINQ